jgi:carboxylesterase type B
MRQANATVILNAVGTYSNGSSITQFMPVYDGKTLFSDTLQRAESGNFIEKPYLIGNNDNELGILEALPGAFGSTLGGLTSSGLPAAEAEEIGNDYAFNCPAAETAASRINNSVKAWRYRYMGVWPNTALAPDIGAYHSSEIPLVFGTTELKPNGTPDTPPEAALSAVMRKAWTTFAKDPENGLSNLGWPVYNPQGM